MDPENARGRRRGTALLDAIRQAVVAELGEEGYGGFSIERVAARAGAGKASIYRRWPSKDELILDAVRGGIPGGGPERRYTGDLRADLLGMYRGMARSFHTPMGPAMRALLAETHRRPELLNALHEVVFDPGARNLRTVLREAAKAGEVDPDVVDREIVTVGHEMLMFRYLTSGAITDDQIRHLVDDLIVPALGIRTR